MHIACSIMLFGNKTADFPILIQYFAVFSQNSELKCAFLAIRLFRLGFLPAFIGPFWPF
jgi:hypothetical protein